MYFLNKIHIECILVGILAISVTHKTKGKIRNVVKFQGFSSEGEKLKLPYWDAEVYCHSDFCSFLIKMAELEFTKYDID